MKFVGKLSSVDLSNEHKDGLNQISFKGLKVAEGLSLSSNEDNKRNYFSAVFTKNIDKPLKLGNTYEVRNFGVSARTLLNKGDHPFMAEMAWRDAKAFAADVVVIKLGTNDSKPENWCYGAEFENNLIQMIDTLCPMVPVLNKKGRPTRKMMRAASPRIFLCTPIHAAKPSWNINDSVITSSIIPIIKKVAQREKLQIIDLNTQFDATDRKLMQQDGIHPTEQGDARIAEIVFEAIKK